MIATYQRARRPSSKWQEFPLWAGGAVLAAVFIGDGIFQLLGRSPLVPLAALQDLPEWLATAVGSIEIAAGAMLLLPAVIPFAAACLGVIMAGGIYLQFQSGTGFLFLSPLLLCVGVAILGYERSPRVRSIRRLKSVVNAFAEEEILREELRRDELPSPAPVARRRSQRSARTGR
jgi:uncharacterized membrane protein YphA (DoxX/SURF4 family)